jgi:hypothetical protein
MFWDSQSRPSYRPSPFVAHVDWMYLQQTAHMFDRDLKLQTGFVYHENHVLSWQKNRLKFSCTGSLGHMVPRIACAGELKTSYFGIASNRYAKQLLMLHINWLIE